MKCPNPKHKKEDVELKTVRTLANGRSVRRERKCPTCKMQFMTVEMLEEDISARESQTRKDYEDLESKYNEALYSSGKVMKVLQEFQGMLSTLNK